MTCEIVFPSMVLMSIPTLLPVWMGRIALAHENGARQKVPQATANPRDWRLLLELAAAADAVIVSGRLIRQLEEGGAQSPPPLEGEVPEDILVFRQRLGLPPQPALVVISNSLDLPQQALTERQGRRVLVATSEAADPQRIKALTDAGIEMLLAGTHEVEGDLLLAALVERDLKLIYSVAGPVVLHTLLEAEVLNRLYLTTVLRVLSGEDYATLARGPRLHTPYDFQLAAMYLDAKGPDGVQQLLQVFERRRALPENQPAEC